MNILTDALIDTVTINGRQYPINTDYRDCLRVIMAFEDNDLTSLEKQSVMLSLLYPDMPDDENAALAEALKFLDGGDGEKKETSGPRVFSFAKDANFIFAAFRQTHNIDLQTAKLHWHEFLALFMDLGGDTTFCQLTALRKRIKTGKATKEERQAAREMGDLFDLPAVDDRTLEEKEAERRFMELIGANKG